MNGSERARILITDRISGEVIAECSGPVGLGECPKVARGDQVPCAGKKLIPAGGTGAEGWRAFVAAQATDHCPLSWLPLRNGW